MAGKRWSLRLSQTSTQAPQSSRNWRSVVPRLLEVLIATSSGNVTTPAHVVLSTKFRLRGVGPGAIPKSARVRMIRLARKSLAGSFLGIFPFYFQRGSLGLYASALVVLMLVRVMVVPKVASHPSDRSWRDSHGVPTGTATRFRLGVSTASLWQTRMRRVRNLTLSREFP